MAEQHGSRLGFPGGRPVRNLAGAGPAADIKPNGGPAHLVIDSQSSRLARGDTVHSHAGTVCTSGTRLPHHLPSSCGGMRPAGPPALGVQLPTPITHLHTAATLLTPTFIAPVPTTHHRRLADGPDRQASPG
jgi:hypothetical protein